jgi:hypothetical protein
MMSRIAKLASWTLQPMSSVLLLRSDDATSQHGAVSV